MKLLRSIALLFAFVLSPLMVSSCGGGSDTEGQLIAPFSLNDIILSIGNGRTTYTFVAASTQPTAGEETGSFTYVTDGGADFINTTGGTDQERILPELLINRKYTYRRTGAYSGEITLTAEVADGIDDFTTATVPYEAKLNLLFGSTDGITVDQIEVIFNQTDLDDGDPATFSDVLVGNSASVSPAGPLPVNYGGGSPIIPGSSPNQASDLVVKTLAPNIILALEPDVGPPARIAFLHVRLDTNASQPIGGAPGSTQFVERGAAQRTTDDFLPAGDVDEEVLYEMNTIIGSDVNTFAITPTDPASLLVPVTYTLTFETFSSGTYTGSDGSTGTFEISGLPQA